MSLFVAFSVNRFPGSRYQYVCAYSAIEREMIFTNKESRSLRKPIPSTFRHIDCLVVEEFFVQLFNFWSPGILVFAVICRLCRPCYISYLGFFLAMLY